MQIPMYLAVAQWALLAALGLLVVTAYRQLGRVLGHGGQPAGLGPPAGSRPGSVSYVPIWPPAGAAAAGARPARGRRRARAGSPPEPGGLATLAAIADTAPRDGAVAPPAGGNSVRVFTPGAGTPALIAFVDPTCPACEQLVTSLTAASRAGELSGVRVLLVTTDPPEYLQISAAFQDTGLEVGRPLDRAELEPYRPAATPLLVALDADGVVARAGTAASPGDVRAFRQACLQPAAPPGTALLPVAT